METRLSLESLLKAESEGLGPKLREEKWDPAFSLSPAPPAGYVWPDLNLEMPEDAASVLLITAPAAMGKSAAARAVAQRLNASHHRPGEGSGRW